MSKPILKGALVALSGSMLLASCAAKAPTQTTTINVEVPDAKVGSADGDKVASAKPEVEIDETEEGQIAKKSASGEPTDRDVENPAPAKKVVPKPASAGKSKNQLLDFYDRLPAKHFVAFGGVKRRSLLARKGAVIDYKHNYIKIPGSENSDDGDLRELQITLFPNGDEPWCAVSRIVWPEGQTPGALDFYYDSSDSGPLRKVSDDFFPYDALGKTADGYMSAFLPRRGLEIFTSAVAFGDGLDGEFFRYNRDFKVGEPAFVKFTPKGNF